MLYEAVFLTTQKIIEVFFGLCAVGAILIYVIAVFKSNQSTRLRKWSHRKTILWIGGVLIASIAVVGPIAKVSHENFVYHMVGHLLLGMLGPLLMALGAPITLLLRTLNVKTARKVSKILKSRFVRFYTQPIITSVMNIGGLWILYTTNLYTAMQEYPILHILIHLHVFAAGYFFTISLLYIDPISRRYSFLYRTVVFIFALAGHGILSKYIYAYPPEGIIIEQARVGAMLMYYGGDAIDLVIIIILFHQWSAFSRRKPTKSFSLSI